MILLIRCQAPDDVTVIPAPGRRVQVTECDTVAEAVQDLADELVLAECRVTLTGVSPADLADQAAPAAAAPAPPHTTVWGPVPDPAPPAAVVAADPPAPAFDGTYPTHPRPARLAGGGVPNAGGG